jgi:hypothetical protein
MSETKIRKKHGKAKRPENEHRRNMVPMYLLDEELEQLDKVTKATKGQRSVVARESMLRGLTV